MQRDWEMNNHATLSASGSYRWINCTPSARLEKEFVNSESEAAAEGTAAHALCEHKLRKALNIETERPVSKYDCNEMEIYTDEYVKFVFELLSQTKLKCKDPVVLIEQHLDFSNYVPEGFGTGDCLIVADGIMHVIDFKYGMGILVDAENNSQMMLYALGAIEIFNSLYDVSEISMTIYQPRRENVSTWTITVDELYKWAVTELKPKACLAYKGEGDYCPGEWCTFCRAAVKCRARAEAKLKLAKFEFALPPLLTDTEIEEILSSIDGLTKWANEILAYASDAAINHGKQWKGFKVVEGRSNRKYTDENAVAEAAKNAGYSDIYKQSLLTITEMESLLGKKRFNDILGALVVKPTGKPILVPITDKRPVISKSNVKNEFKKIMED